VPIRSVISGDGAAGGAGLPALPSATSDADAAGWRTRAGAVAQVIGLAAVDGERFAAQAGTAGRS
jgi:hypothetical protein